MLHIVKAKDGKKEEVKSVSNHNGKLLQDTNNQTFSRRAGVWTHVRAMMELFWGCHSALVQDDTVNPPIIYHVDQNEVHKTAYRPHLPYKAPGKKRPLKQAKLPLPKTRVKK